MKSYYTPIANVEISTLIHRIALEIAVRDSREAMRRGADALVGAGPLVRLLNTATAADLIWI